MIDMHTELKGFKPQCTRVWNYVKDKPLDPWINHIHWNFSLFPITVVVMKDIQSSSKGFAMAVVGF